ncbi:MAG: bifunctional phosphopantothenoylcysteine decarboxylase/phosphopantothenate--cysteine ligase CoaBC [Bacteroidetes bacterium CG12_big_fil_rev_8_21_14_0_65_60_17]|nr:MAG: bifunctional phosphopantothenoylcysteine decarboxylase/phosphopantothenate--cysteine ligase CoaBC [Bacteroidetes bacterium CG12_big_fil_rev_8_21_14_0_65_60_17]
MTALRGKHIVLGVSGGIAAYKAAELVRLYKKAGARVRVLMTEHALRFVTPLTLGTLSEEEVHTGIFPTNEEGSWTRHVGLGLWADVMVVAPATAQTIAKLADGTCDSMLTAVALSRRCPLLVCPAMDHDMYEHPATQANMETLRSRGDIVMDAAHGELASGLVGKGRLPEPPAIVDATLRVLEDSAPRRHGPLAGKTVTVTAGPTREPIDPVRYISNRSSGTMGFALAETAARLGAEVTLISGPVTLSTPDGVERRIDVETTAEMHEAVLTRSADDIIVMVAAVADFAPAAASTRKIKKDGQGRALELVPTVDILADLGARRREGQQLIGFALETNDGLENARGKLTRKNLDWIVLNVLGEDGAGFGPGTNKVTLLGADGSTISLPVLPKADVAAAIVHHTLLQS